MPATIRQRAQSLEPGALIEHFEADFTTLGGPIFYFHNYPTEGNASIFFQGNEYIPYPIKCEGFEYKTTGTLPRPHLFLSNVGSTISALLREYADCINAKVTRRRTFEEFLDDQPGADPTQEFPPDVFYVDRKVTETNTEVEFELVSAADIEGVQLPRRQIISMLCMWVYRSPDCSYAGAPVTDEKGVALAPLTDRGAHDDATTYALGDYTYTLIGGIRLYYVSLANGNNAPLTDKTKWTRDMCTKRLTSGCKAHFGANNPLPFGGFPGTARLPSQGN
jgi:lambda family phage minor tail protein L